MKNINRRRKICVALILAIAILGLVSRFEFARHADAQSNRARIQQDLDRVFARHEDLSLDARAFADRVRENGRASLVTRANDFEMQLRPNDVRAANYRAVEVGSDGKAHELPLSAVDTYKGSVEGLAGSDARFTITDDRVEGMILAGNDSYFVEPAGKYSDAAQPSDYILYRASDVRSDIFRTCADTLNEKVSGSAGQFMSSASSGTTPAVFSPFKLVELATEADFDYVSNLGGSAAANSNILSIVNQMNAIYERDIGMTFKVVFQHSWDTPNDPYSASGNPVAVLNEFTNYWNAEFVSQPRDETHMWTGRSLGGPNGIAWQGTVCRDAAASYAVSDLETIAPFRVTIPAHEIGHNFSATHSDGQAGCDNTIMVATQSQSNSSTFCSFSINQITTYVTANSGCLSDAPTTNPMDDPTFFVSQHYTDFLNRKADQSGLDFWVGGITSCGANAACIETKRIDTSAAFFLSIEFQQTGYLVERTYKTAYGDDPNGRSTLGGTAHSISVPIVRLNEFMGDSQVIQRGLIVGQAGWEAQLESNKVNYFSSFVQSKRFIDKYPTATLPATFVQTLNDNAGRPLSAAELATLTAEHTTGQKNRASVLRQIAEHPNLVKAEFNRAFVLMQFFGYLRRNPNDPPDNEYAGYEFWLNKLNQFGDYKSAEMVKAFLSSLEYRRRFGQS